VTGTINEGSSWSLPKDKIPPNILKEIAKWDSYDISTEEKYQAVYDRLEDANEHTATTFLECKHRGDIKGALLCCLIEAIHRITGGLPSAISQFRTQVGDGKIA